MHGLKGNQLGEFLLPSHLVHKVVRSVAWSRMRLGHRSLAGPGVMTNQCPGRVEAMPACRRGLAVADMLGDRRGSSDDGHSGSQAGSVTLPVGVESTPVVTRDIDLRESSC